MSGYLVRYIPGGSGLIGVYRPGGSDPSFMVPTVNEAFDLIEIDRKIAEGGQLPQIEEVKIGCTDCCGYTPPVFRDSAP